MAGFDTIQYDVLIIW